MRSGALNDNQVTYEEVEAACGALKEQNERISVRQILAVIGRGF